MKGEDPWNGRVKVLYTLPGKYLLESHYYVQRIAFSESTEGNSRRQKLPLIASSAEVTRRKGERTGQYIIRTVCSGLKEK